MHRNKTGFTLVELLAVIVILAVIILIAVTAVIPRMNKAKKNAFIDEALIYLRAGNDAYIADEGTECYDISDMSDQVSQTKEGYSGVLYVNESGKTLHITNGKYYLITDDIPTSNDIVETKPSNFVDSCSYTSNSYTITYELNGGTLASANPSSYTVNTPTITLNNPTKSGYVFTGWSSKNLFDIDTVFDDYYIKASDGSLYRYVTTSSPWSCSDYIEIEGGKTYTFNPNSSAGSSGVAHAVYDINKNFIQSYTTGLKTITAPSDAKYMRVSYRRSNSSDIQLELGSTATEYQEYMAPTTNAKIYRGSTGNRKYVANFTNIFKITLDSQDATTPAIDAVYYQYNTTQTIDNVLCYYYTDKELTNCLTNGYYITKPVKTGYKFNGFYTEPNGGGTMYVNAAGGFTNNIWRTLGDRTLYAKWTPN